MEIVCTPVNGIMKCLLMLNLIKILQTLFELPTFTHISWTTTSSSSPGAPTTTSTSTMSSMSLIILNRKQRTKDTDNYIASLVFIS